MSTMAAGSPAQLRIASCLGAAGALATLAVMPYLLALQPHAFAGLPVSPAVLIIAQCLQAGVVTFLLAWAGLKIGAPIGLGAPWFAVLLYRARPRPPRGAWWLACACGVLASGLVIAASAMFGAPVDPASTPQPDAWKGLLAAPYGAIVEEVSTRVFLLGTIAWCLLRMRLAPRIAWPLAIVLAALAFGAGHLPAASQLVPLDAGVVARVVGYNAIAALVFGWLYRARGLEHAMLAHFVADLVLHVASPVLAR